MVPFIWVIKVKKNDSLLIDLTMVGQRIKKIRLDFNCTMEQFAKLTSTGNKATVNNWEKGTRLPNSDSLELIAILGKTSVNYLLFGSVEDYISCITTKDSNVYQHLKKIYATNYKHLFDYYESLNEHCQKSLIDHLSSQIHRNNWTIKDQRHFPDLFIAIVTDEYNRDIIEFKPTKKVIKILDSVKNEQLTGPELKTLEFLINKERTLKGDESM